MSSANDYLPFLNWIDEQHARMCSLVEQWANINSGSSNTAGLKTVRQTLQKAFGPLGERSLEIELGSRLTLDDQGTPHCIPTTQGLSIIKRPSAPIQAFLNGHMDTVFGLDSPFQTCKLVGPETLNGPGVADLKGGLVILLIAVEAFERSPWAQNLGWELFFNPDEEIGSVGSTPYIEQQAPLYDFGLIMEPQFSDGAFVSGRKGSANYALVSRGKSAHVGREFHKGVNAIVALLHPLQQLSALNTPNGTATLNVGVLHGGTVSNIVPDQAIARLDLRFASDSEMESMQKQIYSIVEEAKLQGSDLEIHQLSSRTSKPFDRPTQHLFHHAKKCAEELGLSMNWRESGGVCDGNTLAAMGVPVIDSMGAAGGNIHTMDEYIELDQLTLRAKHVALLLMKIASGAIEITL